MNNHSIDLAIVKQEPKFVIVWGDGSETLADVNAVSEAFDMQDCHGQDFTVFCLRCCAAGSRHRVRLGNRRPLAGDHFVYATSAIWCVELQLTPVGFVKWTDH